MDFRSIISNITFRIFALTIVVSGIIYLLLRLTLFDQDPLLPLLNDLYYHYLLIPEWIANQIFVAREAGVLIRDHQFVFEVEGTYQLRYSRFIDDWQKFLLHKRWSALILLLIWGNFSTWRRKVSQSLVFLVTHLFAVFLGLLLIGILGPKMIHDFRWDYFSPTLAGNFVMLILFSVILISNKGAIRHAIDKLGIRINVTDRKMNEIIVLLLFLMVLRDYLIPFIEYRPYVLFLLEISRLISSMFGYEGYIVGDQLVGATGALALSKHCLGFMTIYLFAAMVYLTRPGSNPLFTLKFIFIGFTFIFISNIARLVLVFIVAQGENGFHRASVHHEVYNAGIYVLIFGLWVVWFEILRKRSASS